MLPLGSKLVLPLFLRQLALDALATLAKVIAPVGHDPERAELKVASPILVLSRREPVNTGAGKAEEGVDEGEASWFGVVGAARGVLGEESLDVFVADGLQIAVTQVPQQPLGHGQVGLHRIFFVNAPGGTQARTSPLRKAS